MVGPRLTWRSITMSLQLLRVALALAIPASLALFYWNRLPPPDLTQAAPQGKSAPAVAQGRHELSWYAPIWERDLQQSPIPEAPIKTVAADAPREPLPILVATLVTEQGRWAQLVGVDGRLRLKTLDDTVGGYRVAAIEPGRVELTEGDNRHVLEVPHRWGE